MQIRCSVCRNLFPWERKEGVRGPIPKICSEDCRKQVKRDKYQVLLKASREAAERRAVQGLPHELLLQMAPEAPTDPVRRRIEELAGLGLEAADIALLERMPVEELRAEYATELARGPAVTAALVAANLLRQAQGSGAAAVNAAWKWLVARAGWAEFVAAAQAQRPGVAVAPEARQEPLGKKAEQNLAALIAERGTTWEQLIQQ